MKILATINQPEEIVGFSALPKGFVIIGLPRSGTTYLSTFLHSHPQIYCSGEEFNPYAVVAPSGRDDRHETILNRDRAPTAYLDRFFENVAEPEVTHQGFKLMLGHNLEALKYAAAHPDLKIIHIWRDNRLAQAASMILAEKTKDWARLRFKPKAVTKIATSPRDISRRWHENAAQDFLFAQWLKTLPHARLSLEYKDLFSPALQAQLCAFLNVDPFAPMASPLRRQGPVDVLDRFEDPKPIKYYFTEIGRGDWLKPELMGC
ncbi:sulfotransferase family protein [Cognatishimia activa]|uniref:Stf0 sulphotransferase n=1 Tax=Cognatishimia activa TaxID=1715691 RepID=A0A0P1ILN8_9RHOB|nr:sulfotransferase [Cognatishimia activa]CUI39869.1 Stf0 sulphotransferase [Cognatishimia activa]CUK24534.1 Stf0 sulphotransferase [Cognatishimia activa]